MGVGRLGGMVLLLFFSALFSGAETAVFSLNRLQVQRLRKEKNRINRILLSFLEDPRQVLITTLVGNNLVNVAFATLMASWWMEASSSLGGWDTGTVLAMAMGVSTGLLLFFGEIAPKTYALRYAEPLARWVALPIFWVYVALTPVRGVLRVVLDAVGKLFGFRDLSSNELVTKEEFRKTVNDSEATGALRETERDLIHRIVDLREISARDIMVPRTEMVCVDSSVTLKVAFDIAQSVGHSRLPVYEDDLDNILFVLHVKDYPHWSHLDVLCCSLQELAERRAEWFPNARESLLRKPLFLPETKRLNALLRDFALEKTQMAILLDEYGGTAGLITLEDIIEEVTGEILDEYDAFMEPDLAENISPERLREEGILLPAKLSLRIAGRLLRIPFDTEMADTVGGYVFGLFGRVPSVGESVRDEKGLVFQVVAMTGTRIQKVLVRACEESS